MSKIDLAKFCTDHLAKQPALKARIDALSDERAFAHAIVEAGAEAGFHFDDAEVLAAMRFDARDPSEISDERLEAVAGGADSKTPPPKTDYLIVTMQTVYISSYQ